MLGKRCRTLQRTASISQNMGPHYLHHSNYHHYHDPTANHGKINAEINLLGPPSQSTNPPVPATFPQIIGFNPIINQDQSPQNKLFRPPDQIPTAQINMSARPPPHDMYDDDPACANAQLQHKMAGGNSTSAVPSLKQSQIMPRSALQTLLAAARQITCTDQPPTSGKNEGNKSPLIKASAAASPSCATGIYVKQGLWQGFTVSETKSKEISANQSIIKTTIMTTETKAAPECYNVNMGEAESDHNIFYVEGTSNLPPDRHISSESQQNQHALYLATSPLAADFTPNLAASMSFMESCYLCKRRLGQGRDIFMYRGESAFCSMECRDKQMRMEERKEKLRCMHFKMNNNMQKQDFYTNTNIANSNVAPHHQHNKPHHHHHHQHLQHSSQVYNNKQHRTSLLTPAA